MGTQYPSFEQWVELFFVRSHHWSHETELPPAVAVEYITRLFEEAGEILGGFPEGRVADGVQEIVADGSEYMAALLDETIPWPLRQRCARSMVCLFAQYFAPRCKAIIIDIERKDNRLDDVCFMWWDTYPTVGDPASDPVIERVNRELLGVIISILAIDSEACWESALHGLGHWHVDYPREVAAAIDKFLSDHPDLHPKLKAYAIRARSGDVQ
jgi:hypothetical protein